MMKSVTSSIELEELLAEHQKSKLFLFQEINAVYRLLGKKNSMNTAEREHLVLLPSRYFSKCPVLFLLFGIQPTLTSLLVFKKGQLVDKKEV